MAHTDEKYMRRCFELARKGLGLTRSNPVVGSVIVHNDRIIGEGYHHEFGGPHAEVLAIRSVRDQSLLPSSTIYVSLEPCSHYGKTPPCSMLITQKGIKRAVISNSDPNPDVNGVGISSLREQGIEVRVGVLEEEGYQLNRRFFTYHEKKRPYVILKWARTRDGFMDLRREPGDPIGPNWITDDVNRTLVHKWRAEEAAILTGTNTVIIDNPRLNVRRWGGQSPIRVTMDRNGRLFEGLNILDGSGETIIFTCAPVHYSGRTRSLHIEHDNDLPEMLDELHNLQIISVIVEGGKKILESFIQQGIWDEARVLTGKVTFGEGLEAPDPCRPPVKEMEFHGNTLSYFRNE